MARATRNQKGGLDWKLERDDAPLSGQLAELREVFSHYTRRPTDLSVQERFIMQLLNVQTQYLEQAAERQEKEMQALKDGLAALQKEIADLRAPKPVHIHKNKHNPQP